MLRLALSLALALAIGWTGAAAAQTPTEPEPFAAPILTIDQNRLFAETEFGKAALARLKAGEDALLAENLRIEQGLEAEERALTEQRAILPAAEFRALAEAFDVKVEAVRAAQRTKYTDLTAAHEADQRRFIEVALPTIGQIMQERGAVVVVDKQTVVVSLKQVDVTDIVISRLDAAIGDGSTPIAPPPPDLAAPDPAPVQP
jgi:Skp family chaperone for outer membrane proteins